MHAFFWNLSLSTQINHDLSSLAAAFTYLIYFRFEIGTNIQESHSCWPWPTTCSHWEICQYQSSNQVLWARLLCLILFLEMLVPKAVKLKIQNNPIYLPLYRLYRDEPKPLSTEDHRSVAHKFTIWAPKLAKDLSVKFNRHQQTRHARIVKMPHQSTHLLSASVTAWTRYSHWVASRSAKIGSIKVIWGRLHFCSAIVD